MVSFVPAWQGIQCNGPKSPLLHTLVFHLDSYQCRSPLWDPTRELIVRRGTMFFFFEGVFFRSFFCWSVFFCLLGGPFEGKEGRNVRRKKGRKEGENKEARKEGRKIRRNEMRTPQGRKECQEKGRKEGREEGGKEGRKEKKGSKKGRKEGRRKGTNGEPRKEGRNAKGRKE